MKFVKFATTKILVEVEVETQFGPKDATVVVKNLLKVTAIKSVKILSLASDYVLHGEPTGVLVSIDPAD